MTQAWEVPPEPITANEGDTLYLNFAWTDKDGDAATPSLVEWGSFDERTGAVLLAAAELPGPYSSTTEIIVPPAATACAVGATAPRAVTIEVVAQFGSAAEQKTIRQRVNVWPLHML